MVNVMSKIEAILNYDTSNASSKDIGEMFYIRGKAYSCLETHAPQAEALLTKAAKLSPTNCDIWTSLGLCLWKKDNKSDAKLCLEEAINRAKNNGNPLLCKDALRELSILIRQMSSEDYNTYTNENMQSITNQTDVMTSTPKLVSKNFIDESIKLAKEAVQLDLNDHKSWYVLGNAYNYKFFATLNDINDIIKALGLYNKAEGLPNGKSNPDLYYNRGNLLRFLQIYDKAVSDYNMAFQLDSSFIETADSIQSINEYKMYIVDVISKLNQTNASPVALDSIDTDVAFGELIPGDNKDKSIQICVVRGIKEDNNTACESYICYDKSGKYGVINFFNVGYNIDHSKIINKYIRINDPVTQLIQSSSGSTIPIIQVHDASRLGHNSDVIGKKKAVKPKGIKVQTFV